MYHKCFIKQKIHSIKQEIEVVHLLHVQLMILTLNEYRGKLEMGKNLFCIIQNIQHSEH